MLTGFLRAMVVVFIMTTAAVTGVAAAADFPARAITIVVGNPAGGPTDLVARILADRVATKFGKPVVVSNRPGANNVVGLTGVARADPDGHTVMVVPSGITFLPALTKGFELDLIKDFEPVTILVEGSFAIFAPPNAPYTTVEQLVDFLRANPERANYANASSSDLLPFNLFRTLTGTRFEIIRYNGAPRAIQAITSGEANFSSLPIGSVKALHDAGKLRVLGLTGPGRSPLAPGIPAMGESSVPVFRELASYSGFAGFWLGIFAPAKTPRPIITQWHVALSEALNDADVQTRLKPIGMSPVGKSPDEFRKILSDEITRWTKVARDNKIEAE